MQIDTQMDAGKGRGLGNGRGGRRFLRIWHGACVQGVQKWHLCSGASTDTSPRLLSLPLIELQFGIRFGAGPECQEMPPPFPAKQGQPDLCGYRGLWHSFPGDRAGLGVMHREEVYGGGSEKSRARQGGRVERPLAAPQALVPGQGKHSLKLLVSEGWEGGIF